MQIALINGGWFLDISSILCNLCARKQTSCTRSTQIFMYRYANLSIPFKGEGGGGFNRDTTYLEDV